MNIAKVPNGGVVLVFNGGVVTYSRFASCDARDGNTYVCNSLPDGRFDARTDRVRELMLQVQAK
jgi:hypothetical protein